MSDLDIRDTVALLTNASSTGAGVNVPVGSYYWKVYGVWDGASAQLQQDLSNAGLWVDVDGAVLTSDGAYSNVGLGWGKTRVEITNAGVSTSLNSVLERMS